jgi:hypothetical protein
LTNELTNFKIQRETKKKKKKKKKNPMKPIGL